MKAEVAERIVEAGEALGLDVELYKDYSGRGMHGEKTAGVVASITEFVQAVALAAVNAEADEGRGYAIVDGVSFLRTDNMARQMIFY